MLQLVAPTNSRPLRWQKEGWQASASVTIFTTHAAGATLATCGRGCWQGHVTTMSICVRPTAALDNLAECKPTRQHMRIGGGANLGSGVAGIVSDR